VTRITIFLLLASTVLVLSGLAAIRSTDKDNLPQNAEAIGKPTSKRAAGPSQPSSEPAPRPFPDRYRVLLTRSIFARDGRTASRAPGGHNVPGQWVGPPGTEATLVFRGVTLTDGSYTAYIEDLTGGGVRRFSRGEDIAAGSIAGISLNGMDYQSGQKVTRIALGQNLGGEDAPPPTPPPAAPTSAPTPPDGNSHGPGRGRPPGPMSGAEPTGPWTGPGPMPFQPR
jgi:hypothetical protein